MDAKKRFLINVKKLKDNNPIIEISRYNLIINIKNHVERVIKEYTQCINRREIHNIFLRYLFLQIANGKTKYDPVFPYKGNNYVQLEKDIKTLIIPKQPDKCQEIIDKLDLCNLCNKAVIQLINNIQQLSNISYELEKNTLINTIEFKILNHKVFINKKNYKKLSKRVTDDVIYCLLLRYKMLNMNTYSLSVPPKIMSMLQDEFQIEFELFGSPMNSYMKHFCSIFGDLEKHFGSYGSFFDLTITKGNFEANPPFDNEIIKLTINKLCDTLNNSTKPILIFLIIPGWERDNRYGNYEGLELLIKNEHLVTTQTKLRKYKHQYYDYNYNVYINACDTYVFILQNDASLQLMNPMIIDKKMKKIIKAWLDS